MVGREAFALCQSASCLQSSRLPSSTSFILLFFIITEKTSFFFYIDLFFRDVIINQFFLFCYGSFPDHLHLRLMFPPQKSMTEDGAVWIGGDGEERQVTNTVASSYVGLFYIKKYIYLKD